jgi:hypothetical protein
VTDEPLKIVGVDVDGVTRPANDGSRGSALYAVPLQLNRKPSRLWAEVFPHVWNSPPQFTTMHRPGIARISGDKIILDGTTMEEVEGCHLATLKVVFPEVDRKVAEIEAMQRAERERDEEERLEHEDSVRKVAAHLKFDD